MVDLAKLAPRPPEMSDEQYAYAVALAAYETARNQARIESDLLEIPADDPGDSWLDEYAEKILAINQRYNLGDLLDLLTKAEDLLLKWAEIEMRHVYGSRFAQVEPVFRNAAIVGKKAELISLCFRFHAPKGGAA